MEFICRNFLKIPPIKDLEQIATTQETLKSTIVIHLFVYLCSCLESFIKFSGYYDRILFEYFTIVFPYAFVTLYPKSLNVIFYTMLGLISLTLLFRKKFNDDLDLRFSRKKPYITTFRSGITILTCIIILAVDFPYFPGRWTKTETFGTTLMDLGVGVVIVSCGLVASERSFETFYQAAKNGLIVAIIGVLRLILTKAVNYGVNISEYGAHWNFFFTLAALQLCLYGMKRLVGVNFFGIGGIVLSVAYEIVLHLFKFQDVIFNNNRSNLILQNKEGIFGLIGSLSLFMISFEMGKMILNVEKRSDLNRIIIKMISGIVLLSILFGVLKETFPPSRKLMNLTFVLWTLAVSMIHIVATMVLDCFMLSRDLILPELVSDNQLLAFLVANLTTGIVNIALKPSLQSRHAAIAILSIHSFVTIICLVLYAKIVKIQVKTMKL